MINRRLPLILTSSNPMVGTKPEPPFGCSGDIPVLFVAFSLANCGHHDASRASNQAVSVPSHERAELAKDSTLPDAKASACVVEAFKFLRFPEPQGGPLTLVYPIVFEPD
jgi:hypothetical protein